MRKTTLLPAVFAISILGLCAAPLRAQAPTDNLNGKTIHLYVESDNFSAFYFQNGDIPFKMDSKYNYSLTLTGRDIYQQDFFFSSNGTNPAGEHYKWKFGKTGLNEATEGRYTVADFAGKTEIWIVVDPAGPITAPPKLLFEAPKTISILNPWTTTAPVLKHGANTRLMTTTPGRCGWFTTLILDPTLVKGHFAEINNTDTYGKGGQPSTEDYDFTALFAAHGSSIWLNSQANTWTPAWPNVDGQCQYQMAITVRDFSAAHPDFDFGSVTGDHSVLGIAQPTINTTTRKPILNTANITKDPTISFAHFDEWWVTDSTRPAPRQNYESCYDIPMSKSNDGAWEYDSYRDSPVDKSFFPAEANNRNPTETKEVCLFDNSEPPQYKGSVAGVKRNGNFCMESHATFIYQKGQEFAFRGDDDVWVFINDKLVVDLGGVHIPKSQTVKLDNLTLEVGKTYKWDLFYCDRQPCGSSLRIKTSIFFKQQRALYGIETPGSGPGSVSLEIWKRTGGTGSCATIGTSSDSTKATSLTYQVLNASGVLVKDLGTGGVFYGGAVNIATPKVTVDTSLKAATWETLTPGATYRVVAFEPANPALKVEIPFKVPVRSYVQITAPAKDTTAKVGELIRVIFGAMDAGLPAAQAVKYVPSPESGLLLFSDAAGTVPAILGSLMTDATGFDTLWVTGTPTATTDMSYKLTLPMPGNSRTFSFTVPKNRVEFHPWSPAVASQTVPVGTQVVINAANLDNGAVLEKAETYKLNFTDGLKVFTDAAMTVPVLSGATVLTTDPTGLDVIYATADSSDPVTKTYKIKIEGPTSLTKEISLTFIMPPLDLPKALSAGIWDDDGDGIGDRIEAAYDRDISSGPPKAVTYKWPSSAATVSVPAADIANGVTGKVLSLKGRFSPDILTAGSGTFTSAYPARKVDSTQSLPLEDHIGPIIRSAEISLGKTTDTLRIRFSEAIGAGVPTGAPADWFGLKRSSDGAVEHVVAVSAVWKDDRSEVTLIYSNVAADVPRAGNLIRIEDGKGLIADERGNTAGPASRFRAITGGKRSEINTVTYRAILPEAGLLAEKPVTPSLQPVNAVVTEVVDRTGRMGHLIKTDLGGYAIKDDFTNVPASQVALEYHASYFTNLGVPIAEEKRTVGCTDALFQGDCVAHRGFVFVGWNYMTRDGVKVATGAYVARIRYAVRVAGVVKERGGLDQVWGILRRN